MYCFRNIITPSLPCSLQSLALLRHHQIIKWVYWDCSEQCQSFQQTSSFLLDSFVCSIRYGCTNWKRPDEFNCNNQLRCWRYNSVWCQHHLYLVWRDIIIIQQEVTPHTWWQRRLSIMFMLRERHQRISRWKKRRDIHIFSWRPRKCGWLWGRETMCLFSGKVHLTCLAWSGESSRLDDVTCQVYIGR